MAKVVQKGFDKRVALIEDRDAIVNKHVGTKVIVENAIDDVDVGGGIAVYVWTGVAWQLLSKGSEKVTSFATGERHTIANGTVMLNNVPVDGALWEVTVNDATDIDDVKYVIAPERLTVDGATITGLDEFNGDVLRVSYAYGEVTSQMSVLIDSRVKKTSDQALAETEALTLDGNTLTLAKGDGTSDVVDLSEFTPTSTIKSRIETRVDGNADLYLTDNGTTP